MQIVDAQIHIWATGLPNNKAHIQETSFTAKQALALMDEAGVHAARIHPPSWDPKSHDLALALQSMIIQIALQLWVHCL